jgi:pyruvate ferredoxin oxidoreductase delta subunit
MKKKICVINEKCETCQVCDLKQAKIDAVKKNRGRENLPQISIGAVITEPGSTAKSKTCGWRTLRPIVDNAKCIKCGTCWQFCPENAISTDIVVDLDFCKGCGICANVCPVKAITMVVEQK